MADHFPKFSKTFKDNMNLVNLLTPYPPSPPSKPQTHLTVKIAVVRRRAVIVNVGYSRQLTLKRVRRRWRDGAVVVAAAAAGLIVVLVHHRLCNSQASNRRLHDEAKPHDGEIQTCNRLKETLFIRKKNNRQIFGVIPFLKIQNDT